MPAAHRIPAPRPLAVALVALAALAPVAAFAVPAPTRAATQAVAILDGSFSPATLTISVGDTVTWTNQDDSPHTVTAGSFDSGNLDAGASFSHTFSIPGTYTYVCSYHGEMQATIVVEAASAPAPAAPSQPSGGDAAAATPAPAANGTSGTTTTTHAGGAHGGDQPDTALPLPGNIGGLLAPMLIGLGLVALAFGLVPMARPRAAAVTPGPRRDAGWRR